MCIRDSFTAVNTSNGTDWWIAAMGEYDTLYILNLDQTGFSLNHKIKLETDFFRNTSGSGTMEFSPDGKFITFYNPYDDLHIYDFDRETGELSNHRYLLIEEFPDNIARFSSVEWSPNSRFIYVSIQDQLWQVDTWEDNLEDGMVLIDVYDGGVDPFPTTFFLMALAPDCRIYMNSTTGAFSYHVINRPNEKGLACDFVQQGIMLPFPSSAGTLPNFPRFRVDEVDKCDPGITSVFGEDIFWRRDLTTYPNPVSTQLTIELPEGESGKVYVFNMEGRLILEDDKVHSSAAVSLDMSGIPTGTYSVEFLPEDNTERRVWTSRVMVVPNP